MELKIGDFIEVYDIAVDSGRTRLVRGEIIGLVGNICHVKDYSRPRAAVFDLNIETWRKVSPLEIELI